MIPENEFERVLEDVKTEHEETIRKLEERGKEK